MSDRVGAIQQLFCMLQMKDRSIFQLLAATGAFADKEISHEKNRNCSVRHLPSIVSTAAAHGVKNFSKYRSCIKIFN